MVLNITDKEFKRFQALVYEQSGISLSAEKQTLLVSRLGKRLKHLGLSSYQSYYDYVIGAGGQEELTQLLDLVSTNKTDFFREPVHFQFLRERVLPELQAVKSARIWSSASSSGEEAYTIAMTLQDSVDHPAQWQFKILASDISTRVLAKAASAIYEKDKVRGVPADVLRRHFLRGTGPQSGMYKIKQHLRQMVAFRRLNLMDDAYPIKTPLDVIFCRNVMIYFDRPTQSCLVSKFYRYLKPGGYLFIGHSESLQWIDHPFTYVAPTIYQKTN